MIKSYPQAPKSEYVITLKRSADACVRAIFVGAILPIISVLVRVLFCGQLCMQCVVCSVQCVVCVCMCVVCSVECVVCVWVHGYVAVDMRELCVLLPPLFFFFLLLACACALPPRGPFFSFLLPPFVSSLLLLLLCALVEIKTPLNTGTAAISLLFSLS